MVTSAAVA